MAEIMKKILTTLLLCWCVNSPIYAQNNEQTITQTSQISADPVLAFALGGFDEREKLLNNWPADAELFNKMTDALEADELYSDGSQNVYVVKGKVITYFKDESPASVDANGLNAVILNNSLKSVLNANKAKILLQSDKPEMRLQAVKTLTQDNNGIDPAVIHTAYNNEKNSEVKEKLGQIKGLFDLQSSDVAVQIAGAKLLGSSDDPKVLALVQDKLDQKNLSPEFISVLKQTEKNIKDRMRISEWGGYLFSGISLASVLLLAALGLAITYGLLGVINMAHGELIMIGAYCTYLVQKFFMNFIPEWSNAYLFAAIPVAFVITALIGMVIERVVIKPLYGRQLETLLATFGVSLILMQLVRMIFGAQNVQVANPTFMSGGITLSSSLILPYSRIAIVGFTAVVVLAVFWLINGTRFGLFIRAVTQNRQMAKAVGIRSGRIDMLAFGLGSGLAGLAGCALSQIGNVGPDLGQSYIIDTFLVVVVGGVGQLWGAVLAAIGLGVGSKFLEIGLGPVLAKIGLLILIILFIQKRPQGLFAVKGRFVE